MNLLDSDDDRQALLRRIERDLIDGYDEEVELEIEDRELGDFEPPAGRSDDEHDRLARQTYFCELFRLQGELVKLQDWVAHTGHKVVIVFAGRDAAGEVRRWRRGSQSAVGPRAVGHRGKGVAIG